MIDTHTHLNFEVFKADWRMVVERAIEAGIERMIVVGTDLASSEKAVEMAEAHPELYAAVGVHPHHAKQIENGELRIENAKETIEQLAKHSKVVAIGEVGLDYHVYKNSQLYEEKELEITPQLKNLQKRLLGIQVELAKKLDKPLILHSREAYEDVLDTMEHFAKSDGEMPKGVFHCFDGDQLYAEKVMRLGFYISFTGNITFVADRAGVAHIVPLNKLLLETDCPFMSPYAKASGGKKPRCEPKDVIKIAEFHAKQRDLTTHEIEEQTTNNARALFKL